MMGELNGAPLWGNHCWICGHDVIAELKDEKPEFRIRSELSKFYLTLTLRHGACCDT